MTSIEELRQNLPLTPSVEKCENFLTESGIEQTVTVVIVPLHFREKENGFMVTWSCNKGDKCHNTNCIYARASE